MNNWTYPLFSPVYVPDASYSYAGPLTFTYQVSDGDGGTALGTVTLQVT